VIHHEPMGNVLILAAGLIEGVSERILAIQWLRADTRARRTSFAPWVVLMVVLPVLGVGLYLLLRPRGRLLECPHCQAASRATGSRCLQCDHEWDEPGAGEKEPLVWRLPDQAIIFLAAIAGVALVALIPMVGYYHYALALTPLKMLIAIGVASAVSIAVFSWVVVRTQRASWQDNPFPLLAGLLLALATIVRLSGVVSIAALALVAIILTLAVALVISAVLHLAVYEVRWAARGLALGYVLAIAATFGLVGPRYGFSIVPEVTALCVALPTVAIAVMSSSGRLESAQSARGRTTFLQVAGPLWGLLCLSLLVSIAVQALR
jgi:hypothetical protein